MLTIQRFSLEAAYTVPVDHEVIARFPFLRLAFKFRIVGTKR